MTLNFRTSINGLSGYRRLIDDILTGLPKHGITVNLIPLETILPGFRSRYERYFSDSIHYNFQNPELILIPPTENFTSPFFRLNPHTKRIILTMWEATNLAFSFVEELNKCKMILVPSEFNKFHFKRQGVNIPIRKLPLYVNTHIFKSRSTLKNNKYFVFGTSNNDPRKRLERTIKNFIKAFPKEENVRFNIKLSPHETGINIMDSRIQIYHENFTDYQMCDWYNNLDCFVSGVSCEGWGFQQLEAMACGTPVIAAPYGGLAEFMTQDNNFPLPFKEVPSEGYWNMPGARWSDFNDLDMIELLRYCFNQPNIVKSKGLLARKTASQFTIERFLAGLVEALFPDQ